LPPGAYFDVGLGFRFHGGRVGVGFDFGLVSDCFTFIPTSRFCDRSPWRFCLPGIQVVNVFNRTTIINNYAGGPNGHTIVNVGPGRNAIAAVTRTEIRKVALRDASPTGGTLVRADRLGRDGKTLEVFRPQLPKQAPAPPPQITRRQQELRKDSEVLVRSEAVRQAAVDAEKRSASAPANRGSAVTDFSGRRIPQAAPKAIGPATESHAPRTEVSLRASADVSQKAIEPSSQRTQVPAVTPHGGRVELRNSSAAPVTAQPSRPERAPRSVAELSSGTIGSSSPNGGERSSGFQAQPNTRSEFRAQPAQQQPVQTPQPRYQSGQPQTVNPPASRPETRRYESPAPTFSAPPSYTPPRNQSVAPAPAVIQPREPERRSSSPDYRPPQNYSTPPATAPRSVEAPAYRPSSQPQQQHYSLPPAVSRSQPAPSSPSPSQSRGDNRKN
jgi:hypothetical protein